MASGSVSAFGLDECRDSAARRQSAKALGEERLAQPLALEAGMDAYWLDLTEMTIRLHPGDAKAGELAARCDRHQIEVGFVLGRSECARAPTRGHRRAIE